MRLEFEYGHGCMGAELPDDTDVFIPGTTVPDQPAIPEEQLEEETRKSIRNPIGMPPLSELAREGSKVAFVIPDIVKGGTQPTAHRKIAIRVILEELYKAGVRKEDVLLIFSNGLHPRTTVNEMKQILGKELFDEFYYTNQITSHDSEDYEHLVDLGVTDRGDPVLMNKYVYDSDIAILIGHVQGNPYGGYSGGYKHCATGITHWRSIASHHVPKVMHREDFTPVSTKSLMRTKFDEIGMLFGMPQNFHYGDGMGTNPIQMMQALSAQVIRHKRVMSERCVIICSSICNGYFHDERWPYLREQYEMFQHDYMNVLPDMDRYGEYFATHEEYIRKYRYCNAFHPFHGFSMMSCGHIAEMNTAAIYIVGAQEPGIARSMGLKTRATFEEALEDAKKKYVGPNPNILALPKAFKLAAPHLCMEDDN